MDRRPSWERRYRVHSGYARLTGSASAANGADQANERRVRRTDAGQGRTSRSDPIRPCRFRAAACGSRRGGLAGATARSGRGRGRAAPRASRRRPTTASGPSCSTARWARGRSAGRHRRPAFAWPHGSAAAGSVGSVHADSDSRPPIVLISRVAASGLQVDRPVQHSGDLDEHRPRADPADVDIALNRVVRGGRAEVASAALLSGRRRVERPVTRRVAMPHRQVRRREGRRGELAHAPGSGRWRTEGP